MQTLAVTNQKGGVGKTTTVHHLGVALSRRGLRVLLVDLDPQAHLTTAARVTAGHASMLEVMTAGVPIADVATHSDHRVDVAPADQLLARIEDSPSKGEIVQRLRNALTAVADHYDVCLIDTPPSLGVLSTAALIAADSGVLVPLLPEALPLKGMKLLFETMSELRQINPQLHIRSVVPTMLRPRWASHRAMVQALPKLLPDIPVAAPVPSHGGFVRAATLRSTIFSLAPKSAAAAAYEHLAEAIAA